MRVCVHVCVYMCACVCAAGGSSGGAGGVEGGGGGGGGVQSAEAEIGQMVTVRFKGFACPLLFLSELESFFSPLRVSLPWWLLEIFFFLKIYIFILCSFFFIV